MIILEQIQPSIFPMGIRIDEPVTMVTDLLVSAVCFYAFFSLYKISSPLKIRKFLMFYFLGMGMATFFGGVIGHGFLYAFSFAWKLPGWITSMLAVMILERAAIDHASHVVSRSAVRFFKWMNIIELVTFMTLTFVTLNFKFVEIHSAYGVMFVVGSYSLFTYWKTRSKASKIFLYGVGFAIVSSIIYLNQWNLHTWFNYLDASHTIMAVAAFILFRGASVMIQEQHKLQGITTA
ncbi:MAG: hypothetical protein PF590_05955 [Candidatus Delongbacteria bacterium]|nr:hypothetical protein [Candidatus Delongbacteria bacterium]